MNLVTQPLLEPWSFRDFLGQVFVDVRAVAWHRGAVQCTAWHSKGWHVTEITLNGSVRPSIPSNFSLKPPPVRLGLTARLAPFPWTPAPRAQQLKMHTSSAESLPCTFKCTRKSKNSALHSSGPKFSASVSAPSSRTARPPHPHPPQGEFTTFATTKTSADATT